VEFWAEFTAGAPKTPRRFQVFGTGHPLPPDARHVGTCPRVSGLVWHLYELVSADEKPALAAPQLTCPGCGSPDVDLRRGLLCGTCAATADSQAPAGTPGTTQTP
jgi:hypothetical protein